VSARHAAPASRGPGERLVAVGVVLFGLGVAAVLVSVVPVLLGADEAPDLPTLLAGVLLPLGLALALVGLLRGARARRRAARRSSTRT
jgi:VIT1/CCC1 family predicted Fe2+/Mn2+ transporter